MSNPNELLKLEDEPIIDDENPEWTEDDFARAVKFPPGTKLSDISVEDLERLFPRTRGNQKAPTKVAVSIRLSADVVQHFKDQGPGWQTRIDETLRKAAKLKAS